MDGQDHHMAHHADGSRPALGFPLGTVLLLVVIFCLSGAFSCCYHWEKLRSLRRSFSAAAAADADTDTEPSKSAPANTDSKEKQNQSLPVLMPGDRIPMYIAFPCPRDPSPPPEKIAVVVQAPPFQHL